MHSSIATRVGTEKQARKEKELAHKASLIIEEERREGGERRRRGRVDVIVRDSRQCKKQQKSTLMLRSPAGGKERE